MRAGLDFKFEFDSRSQSKKRAGVALNFSAQLGNQFRIIGDYERVRYRPARRLSQENY